VNHLKLVTFSQQILNSLEECRNRFEQLNGKPEKTEDYFYMKVKPTFESIMENLQKWKPLAEDWVRRNRPKYIHQSQIDSAIENMEQVVLQSFYKDVNNQRFHNLHHSVEYILCSIIDEIEEKDDSR
jgi:hypothetical protein